MRSYAISNTHSGAELGIYEAASATDALDQMAQHAGYADYADLGRQVPSAEGEIVVEDCTDERHQCARCGQEALSDSPWCEPCRVIEEGE